MFLKMWLLPLLIATSALASPSPAPEPQPTPQQYSSPEPPRASYYPSSSQRPVYTAQRNRDESAEDDEPYPSTSNLGTAQTSHGAEEPENTGFVEPIDFKTLLSGVGSSPKGSLDLGASSSNPLFASESKNSFAGFFGSNNKDPFADFGGGGLATASSDRSSKGPSTEDDTGFVDPDVQFRSLFDSSQTASNGFKPEDFLGNKGDSSGAEPSRGSQTRTFPSFTYSGRKDDDNGSNNPRYRSSYRQVDSQDDDYNNSPRNRGERDDGPSSYDDRDQGQGRDYYGSGEQDDSPQRGGPPPPSSSPRYNQGPRYSPATQETSHRPQSTGRGPKAAESKNPKCKKVEKSVDYSNNDDEYASSFTEPEPDYDPSTYRGRHKRQSRQGRQSRGGGGGGKRPMTCYVCEDEQGRYAEKCSYDSKANPNKGEYFHSTSSAYSDNGNGRRPSGKQDRHRRNPNRQQTAEASATTLSSVAPGSPQESSNKDEKPQSQSDIEESEPNKVIEKRQSGGDRYASNFGVTGNNGGNQGGNRNNNNNNNYDFNPSGGEYDLPRGYLGNNGGRVEGFEDPSARSSNDNNRASTGSGREGGGDNFGFVGNNNNNREFDFGNNREFNDFNFGAPNDFGRESSPTAAGRGGGGGQGFSFDFSIPREYDPDVQLGGRSNTNGRPGLDGSASSSSNAESFPVNFDTGYDDYVKQHFPDSFGPGSSSGSTAGPSSSPSYSPSSPSYSHSPSSGPSGHSNTPSYRPRGPSREHSFNQHDDRRPQYSNRGPSSGSPDKEHTQPSHNFSPPPNFFGKGNDDHGAFENTENLHKLMDNFSGKDRSGCQKVQKGDMSCYVCRDASGMNKEECMYASNDPKNQRMAYHEVTEYSSDPPASILPLPRPETLGSAHGHLHQSGSSPVASSVTHKSVSTSSAPASSSSSTSTTQPSTKAGSVTRVESKVVTTKILHENKSPVEYDFDY